MKKLVLIFSLIFVSGNLNASDIAFGKIVGIKVYDFSNSKVTKIKFDPNSDRQLEAQCQGVGLITHASHDSEQVQRFLSIALAGYMSGKNVRAYTTTTGSCEVELLAIEDQYF